MRIETFDLTLRDRLQYKVRRSDEALGESFDLETKTTLLLSLAVIGQRDVR